MTWLPNWLGEAYCALYSRLRGILTAKDAASVLGVSEAKATLILSRLTQAGWIERPERGRYRAIEPSEVFERISMSKEIEGNLAQIPQREFAPPLRRFMDLVIRRYGRRLVSAAVFGSLARGSASWGSDIDLLLVIKGLPPRIVERYDEIGELDSKFHTSLELQQLMSQGKVNPIQPVLYTPREASEVHDIYLDMTQHVVILYDRGRVLQGRLNKLSRRLDELGSKRLVIEDKPVWILKPDLKRGEAVALE